MIPPKRDIAFPEAFAIPASLKNRLAHVGSGFGDMAHDSLTPGRSSCGVGTHFHLRAWNLPRHLPKTAGFLSADPGFFTRETEMEISPYDL
jgi:hypothetical protein